MISVDLSSSILYSNRFRSGLLNTTVLIVFHVNVSTRKLSSKTLKKKKIVF